LESSGKEEFTVNFNRRERHIHEEYSSDNAVVGDRSHGGDFSLDGYWRWGFRLKEKETSRAGSTQIHA
jgi:hypothetical protein